MVKLPVIYLQSPYAKRSYFGRNKFLWQIEKISAAEKIRSIILFQEESNSKGDCMTFEKVDCAQRRRIFSKLW